MPADFKIVVVVVVVIVIEYSHDYDYDNDNDNDNDNDKTVQKSRRFSSLSGRSEKLGFLDRPASAQMSQILQAVSFASLNSAANV
jgi:hypothetical protein